MSADFPSESPPWHTGGIFNCALAVLQGQVDLMAFQSASICPGELWIHAASCGVLTRSADFAWLKFSQQVFFCSRHVAVSFSPPPLSPCVTFVMFHVKIRRLTLLLAIVFICHQSRVSNFPLARIPYCSSLRRKNRTVSTDSSDRH